MKMKILVNGLLENNSGKTWTILALHNALRSKGFRVGLYKPISGHSGWRQFNTVLKSIEKRILVCEDVLKYLEYTKAEYPIELINPIDFLLIPTDFNIFRSISEYLMSLENQYRQGVLVRISGFKGATNHYRVIDNCDRVATSLKPWLDKLIKIFNPIDIDLKQLFNILSTEYVDKILDNSLKMLDKENDMVLIESFNNASIPYKKIIHYIDKILTVTPGYIIEPIISKAKKLLNEKLEKYLTSETLLSETGIQGITLIPPYENINKLSQHILQNWSNYKKTILNE